MSIFHVRGNCCRHSYKKKLPSVWHQWCFENLQLSHIWRYDHNYLSLWLSKNLTSVWSQSTDYCSEFRCMWLLLPEQIRTCPFSAKLAKNTHVCHTITACLLFLTERNAWEICSVHGMPHNLPLFPVFFITVEPANSTGKIFRRLHSLEVKIRPNCLFSFCSLSTERPEGQL